MADYSAAQRINAKMDSVGARLDGLMAAAERRELDRLRAEEREAENDAREQARADADRCRQIQATYQEAFESFGLSPPMPIDGQRPGSYRRKLFTRPLTLQRSRRMGTRSLFPLVHRQCL